MAIRVLNLGEQSVSNDSNRNTPTTPMVNCDSQFTGSNPIAVVVYPDDSTDGTLERITSSANMLDEYSNLEKTEGNTLKVYDSFTSEGIDLSTITDVVNNNYFVMIHSDNYLKHHFAKITEIHTTDTEGDSIKFEPSLGNEIPHGVKFKLYKGPASNTNFIAIGLGIKNDLQNSLHISRPYVWFNTSLKQKNELDNNTKYFLRVAEINNSTTVNLSGSTNTTFLVSQDYANEIKDYGRYTLRTRLVDNLKDLDFEGYSPITFTGNMNASTDTITNITGISVGTINDLLYRGITKTNIPEGTYVTEILSSNSVRISQNPTATISTTPFVVSHSNESHTLVSNDFTDYETSFFNARRDGDDLVLPSSNFTSKGPTRYLHYDYSNDKVNYSYNVIDMSIDESIKGKTSFADISLADMNKIYPSKLEVNTSMRARQRLERNNMNVFVDTGLTVSANGAQVGTNNDGYLVFSVHITGVQNYFSTGEEIKIENRLYVIDTIETNYIKLLQADTTNDGVANTYSRLEAETSYTDIGVPNISVGDTIYRRAYSPFKKNLITNFDLISNRHNDLYLVTTSKNSIYNYFKCSSADINNNVLTFTVDLDKYLEEGMHFTGDYYLYYEKLNGTIEVLDYYRKDGQSIMKVEGRDIMSQILSPIINKDSLFSDDIIYSSYAPINDLIEIGYVEANFGSQDIIVKNASNANLSISLVEGDRLYVSTTDNLYKFLGEINFTASSHSHILKKTSNVKCGGDTYANNGVFKLWKARKNNDSSPANKNYVFNKALASNILVDSVTSLSGSSNKGLFFTGGMRLNEFGVEQETLVNTSSSDNSNAIGYHISKVDGDINGADYQAVLGDGQSTETHETFLSVNSLMDYSVLSVIESGANKVIEIAPYVPLSLGRLESNFGNIYDVITTTVGFTAHNQPITDPVRYIYVSSQTDSTAVPAFSVKRNDAIFVNDRFVGFALEQHIDETFSYIALDRPAYYTTNATVTAIRNKYGLSAGSLSTALDSDNKYTHELELLNVAHLHGGKTISHMQHFNLSPKPLDVSLTYNDGSQISSFEKFGNPVYTIYSLEKGNEINYVAAYKTNVSKNLSYRKVKSRLTTQNYNHLPIEARGYFTPTYSNFDDKQIGLTAYQTYAFPLNFTGVDSDRSAQGNLFNTNTDKESLEIRQKSVDRMFIFVNSDELPYHQLRVDSLANDTKTRTIDKYNIVGILPTNSDNSLDNKQSEIQTERHSNVDEDYSVANIISSDKNINSLMNVGLMRLTEVVVDWAFNQIDPENIIENQPTSTVSKKIFTPMNLLGGNTVYYAQSGSYNVGGSPRTIQLYDAASGGNVVNFINLHDSSAPDDEQIKLGDAIIAADTGFLIGIVRNDQSPNSIINDALFANSDKSAFYTGAVKKIPVSQLQGHALGGRGGEDNFMGFDSGINMLRTAYFNSPAHTSNQRYVNIEHHSTYEIPSMSVGTTPAPSITYIALQFINQNGIQEGYFFWFNKTNSDGNQIDTIPAAYAASYSPHSSGITYTAVEIGLPDNYSHMDFHSALQTAFDSVNLQTNHVYGGQTGTSANYGGTLVTKFRTKRNSITNELIEGHYATVQGGALQILTITNSKVNTEITADNTGWGKDPSAYYTKWSEILGGEINNYVSEPRKGGAYLPISVAGHFDGSHVFYSDVLSSILSSPKSRSYADISTTNSNEMKYTGFIPVALSSFIIEDSKEKKKISVGETFPAIEALFKKFVSSSTSARTIFGLVSSYSDYFNKYEFYMDFGATKQDNPNLEDEGNGMLIGFKPRLDGSLKTQLGNLGDYKQSTGQSVYPYSFNTNNNKLSWLKHLDLTGCYLVRTSNASKDDNVFIEGLNFAYVISHEIDPTDTNKVILTLDTTIGTLDYKIFQPNHTCFYDFSPTEINIGYISSSYTKKPNANECYDVLHSHAAKNKTMERNDSVNDMEGIGSLYVLLDLSGKVHASQSFVNDSMQVSFHTNLPSIVCLSDGEKTFKSGLRSDGYNLKFDSVEKLKGIVSISEIIKLNVGKQFNGGSKRCLIGNTVSIVQEAEELAQSLLEKENITFTSQNEPNYSLFTAPNFQGNDLLSATRFLLNKKGREIETVDGSFIIDSEDSSDKYANVLLSEEGKYQIYEFEKQKTTFAFYNEIILYGSSHKSVKKDLRSIKKVGRKTLEVFDNKLTTQEEVDKEARDLLKLHSRLNESYKVTASTTGLEQIKSGDIVQFELKRENIERDEYIVLSISHKLTGFMELELGKYAKSLDDRLVELITDTKDTKSQLRNKDFASKEESLETLDEIKIKEIRVLVRKRSTTGNPLKLGFGTQLNTGSVQLGFAGGQSIVITNLREDNL